MDRMGIAAALVEMAELMELAGENPFRARAYLTAARVVAEYNGPLAAVPDVEALGELDGIGSAMVAKIATLLESGTLPELEELRRKVPSGLRELIRVPGLGIKKIRLIHETLGIRNLAELESAARENRLLQIPGFGAKTQENIVDGLSRLRRFEGQWLLPEARIAAELLRAALVAMPGVSRAASAGEVRRWHEIVGAIEMVVAADPAVFAAAVSSIPGVIDILEQSSHRMTIRLRSGIAATLHLVSDEAFPAAVVALTGSAAHVASLAARAGERGLRLTEHGLFRNGAALPLADEVDLYHPLGLPWIPPECREGLDEVERAARGELAELVVASDLRGLIHVHSTWSDGRAPILEMARAAAARGFSYLGISDHSRAAAYAGGLDIDRVMAQRGEIERLNEGESPVPILAGIEADILVDGSLDYPDDVLAGFDFVIASVHSRFRMSRDEMTARVLRAVSSPYVTILAHPTGRMLLQREGYDIDLDAVIAACARERVVVEINANPNRLELDWRHIAPARAKGAIFAINPDAHAPDQMDFVGYGVAMARKGGLTAREVVNTWRLDEARPFFRHRRAEAGTSPA